MKDIRVALGQINCRVGDAAGNLARHRRLALEAAAAGARAICFPEASLTGYPQGDVDINAVTMTLDDPAVRSIIELSREAGLMILAGLAERDPAGTCHVTQMIADGGRLIGRYRKTHLSQPERRIFTPGRELPVFEIDGMRFAVQICYDNHFPESCRVLSLKGVDVIFSPFASPGPCTPEGLQGKQERWKKYLMARSFDNSVYIMAINQVGNSMPAANKANDTFVNASSPRQTNPGMTDYPGGMLAFNCWGELLACATETNEQLYVHDLTAAPLLDKRSDALQCFELNRRPELYGMLTWTGD